MNSETLNHSLESDWAWFGVKWSDLRGQIDGVLVDNLFSGPTEENAQALLRAWVRYRLDKES